MGATARPTVLLSVSGMGWAFENIARQLEKRLSDQYSFTIKPIRDIHEGDAYDVVVNFYWWDALLTRKLVIKKREIVCLYDLFSTGTAERALRFKGIANEADAVIAGNDAIYERIREIGVDRPCFVCPDGVDCELFTQQPLPPSFTVGWTGNTKFREQDFKGVLLIQAAAEQAGVALRLLDYEHRIPHRDMCGQFYRNISAYACASMSEGTPNPVLEALACGRPCITTRVGITDRLIVPGRTGIFVDRTVDDLANAMRQMSRWDIGKVSSSCRGVAELNSWTAGTDRWGAVLKWTYEGGLQPFWLVPANRRAGNVGGT